KLKIRYEKSGDNERYQEKSGGLSWLNEIPVDIPRPPWYKYPCSDCNPELLICKAKQRISIYGGNTMSTFMANKANIERKWYILDAAGKPLGKTAVRAADLLRGKTKPTFTPNADC